MQSPGSTIVPLKLKMVLSKVASLGLNFSDCGEQPLENVTKNNKVCVNGGQNPLKEKNTGALLNHKI